MILVYLNVLTLLIWFDIAVIYNVDSFSTKAKLSVLKTNLHLPLLFFSPCLL